MQFKILDRFIFIEILKPFFISLFFWTTLFMSLIFKEIIGDLIGKGVDTIKIIEYIIYLIGEKITNAIPIACLFAAILSSGRLSGDSEITAIRSAGISFRRIYLVYIIFGSISSLFVGFFYFYWGPLSSKKRLDFEEWLKAYHSLSLVKSGRFMNFVDTERLGDYGQDIYAQYRNGSTLVNVQIRKWKNQFSASESYVHSIQPRMVQIIQARKGQILTRINEDGTRENFIRLESGYMMEFKPDWTGIEITDFTNGYMDLVFMETRPKIAKLDVKPENYTFPQLLDFLKRLEKGEHRIDITTLTGGDLNIKMDKISEGERIPSIKEMKNYIAQTQVWLLQNLQNTGKPGGPTIEEYNQKAQLVLKYQIFLKDVEKTKRRFEVEIHRRIAIPISSIIFVFVGFPLGLVSRRTGKGMGFTVALFTFLIYYFFLTLGISNAYEFKWSSFAGVWSSHFIIFGLGFYQASRKTDDFPFFSKFLSKINLIVKKTIYPTKLVIVLEDFLQKISNFSKNLLSKK